MKLHQKFIFILKNLSIIKTVYYSLKYNSKILVGKNVFFNLHKGAKITVTNGKLFIGCYHTVKIPTVLDIYNNGRLSINGSVSIGKGSKLMIGENALLEIGNLSSLNENSRIQCRNKVHIGERCAISWNVNILDTDEHNILLNGRQTNHISQVFIGDHVWIGCNSTILKGTKIGESSIIASGSLVNKNVSNNQLVGGVPAKLIRDEVNWE